MNSKNDQIVCLLDVLGFKSIFLNLGLELIESKYKELISIVEKQSTIFAVSSFENVPVVGTVEIHSAYFSDTIVFWCNYDRFRLELFINCMMEVLCRSIEINLPLRGAISIGEVKLNKEESIFLGKPIIDAVNAETAQKWIGITFAKVCEEDHYINGIRADLLLQYEKHIKNDNQADVIPLVLDFPRVWRNTRVLSLKELIMNLNIDPKYKDYYNNTIDFIEFSEKNKEWWIDLEKFTKLKVHK